jgi:hypothetical protein
VKLFYDWGEVFSAIAQLAILAGVVWAISTVACSPAHAASLDLFAGAVAANGDSGTENMVGIGLDLPTNFGALAMRLTRASLDDGYATGLTIAGEVPIRGVLYGTLGAGLTMYERDEVLTLTGSGHKKHRTYTASLDAPDGSAIHLQGGFGAVIPAGRVGVTLEAVYRLPLHDGSGGVAGLVGVAVPLP